MPGSAPSIRRATTSDASVGPSGKAPPRALLISWTEVPLTKGRSGSSFRNASAYAAVSTSTSSVTLLLPAAVVCIIPVGHTENKGIARRGLCFCDATLAFHRGTRAVASLDQVVRGGGTRSERRGLGSLRR